MSKRQTAKPDPPDLLSFEQLAEAAECLKVLAHPVRLRIVDILMHSQVPVNRIAQLCQLPPHQTCEHLRLLKGHGLLASSRKGREVYYSVAQPRLGALLACLRSNCPASASRT